jgi:hypothetical protein
VVVSGLGVAGADRREDVLAMGLGGATEAVDDVLWLKETVVDVEKRLRSAISLCLCDTHGGDQMHR